MLPSDNDLTRRLAERGVEIFFTQVFRDNFFHADIKKIDKKLIVKRISMSIIRSVTMVPNEPAIGILSDRFNINERVNSPALGIVMFTRYPIIKEWY